ncbi:MAG TPA: hypothetical protein VH000_00965 [Rhizomicrobium sp.]|jgi:hypothetical protein|nr:hypothetical protein [Rhizomicrobium sp.]
MFAPPARQIAVKTIPAGARCEFDDQGYMLANVDATPGTASVEMPDHEVQVVCRLAGRPNVTAMVGNQNSVSLTFEPAGPIPNAAPTQPVTATPIPPPDR